MRILVVEDYVDAAMSLDILLTAIGHEVEVAHDGLAGVEAASTFDPDVVILDIGLPKLDGFEVARRIREQPALAKTCLIAITGYSSAADKQRAGEVGFDHYFVKPTAFEDVEQVLLSVLP